MNREFSSGSYAVLLRKIHHADKVVVGMIVFIHKNYKKKNKANAIISCDVVRKGNVVKGYIVVKIHNDNVEIKTSDVQRNV